MARSRRRSRRALFEPGGRDDTEGASAGASGAIEAGARTGLGAVGGIDALGGAKVAVGGIVAGGGLIVLAGGGLVVLAGGGSVGTSGGEDGLVATSGTFRVSAWARTASSSSMIGISIESGGGTDGSAARREATTGGGGGRSLTSTGGAERRPRGSGGTLATSSGGCEGRGKSESFERSPGFFIAAARSTSAFDFGSRRVKRRVRPGSPAWASSL